MMEAHLYTYEILVPLFLTERLGCCRKTTSKFGNMAAKLTLSIACFKAPKFQSAKYTSDSKQYFT